MREALPLADAAKHLNVTPAAVHKRLRRGTLDGYKRDGRWLVWVDTDMDPRIDADSGQRVGPSRTDDASSMTVEAAVQAVERAYSRLVDEQAATIQHLRDESERKDVIIMQLSEQVKALPAPTTDPEPAPEPWWRRWF